MIAKKDGGPAFPIPLNPGESWNANEEGNPNGMTLRDYFAARAMQGSMFHLGEKRLPADMKQSMAQEAYAVADAMLEERDK